MRTSATSQGTPGGRRHAVVPWRRGWAYWAVIFGSWTLIGFFYATRPIVRALSTGQPVPDQVFILPDLADAYTWALFTPAILWLADRFPFRKGEWLRHLVPHVLAAAAFATLSVAANVWVARFFYPDEPVVFGRYFAFTVHWNVQWYAMLVGIGHALEWYRRYRDRELHASRLETQLVRAQLQALKMQIQPHFLFNTLHTISELIHQDPEAADRMITRLGDLLRLSVENAGTHEVPLKQELDFLRAYLEIEQTRFRDRLAVQMQIEPETLDARVPNLILQPLVENAIKHGIAPRGRPGEIGISAVRDHGVLRIKVRDNGTGLPAAVSVRREGVGLRNTRARLEQLYGPAHHFELRNASGGGVVATLVLPFNTDAPAPRAAGAGAPEEER